MYQLIMPAYSVIMSFTMSGLTLAVSRLCAQYQAAGDSGGVRGVVRFSQLVFLCLFGCAAVPVCLFPDLIAGVVLGGAQNQSGAAFIASMPVFNGI